MTPWTRRNLPLKVDHTKKRTQQKSNERKKNERKTDREKKEETTSCPRTRKKSNEHVKTSLYPREKRKCRRLSASEAGVLSWKETQRRDGSLDLPPTHRGQNGKKKGVNNGSELIPKPGRHKG